MKSVVMNRNRKCDAFLILSFQLQLITFQMFLIFYFQNSVITDLVATDIDEEGPNNEIHFDLISVINLDNSKEYMDLFTLDYKISKDSFWWVDNKHKKAHLTAAKNLKDNYGRYNISIEVSRKK